MDNLHEGPRERAAGPPGSAEQACEYILAKAKVSAGHLFRQGRRDPPLECRSESSALRLVAEERIYRIPLRVVRALVAWGNGFPVELLTSVPSADHVLELQARGQRCVSLLPQGEPTFPHGDPLDFALHDLCHLDKFIDAEHHVGQVGFFGCLRDAVGRPEWRSFQRGFDETFRRDLEHVMADMNGSAVFLFAALKMKLKMAVRRRLAETEGRPPLVHGALTPVESRAYEDRLSDLLTLLRWEPHVDAAARATSAKRDDPRAARMLLCHFEDVGRRLLREKYAREPKFD